MKGFRTLLANPTIVAVPVVLETLAFLDAFDWRAVLPSNHAGWLVMAIGLLNIWLRFVTTTAVGQKH